MSGFNFSNVEEAREIGMTPPGTIDVFKIKEVTFDSTKVKSTYYMKVVFNRKQDQFNHSFFLSEKALPRIKSLVKHASGTILSGASVQEEELIRLLVGKDIALKVTGKIDEANGRAYADLSFGGFSKEPTRISELFFRDEEVELNEKANKIRSAATAAKPDAEEGIGEGTSAPATGEVSEKDEIF